MDPPTLAESYAVRKVDPSGRRYHEVDVSSLDDVPAAVWRAERANNILRAYAEDKGDDLPPIRIAVGPDGREVVDGMHRLSVARAVGAKRIGVVFLR